ncbi:MAG: hypothetical protein H0U66_18370 [Gemmatimonadaceae bacterium]|nr:hypothetical protein [Gemmatimonadaceae bacterium]
MFMKIIAAAAIMAAPAAALAQGTVQDTTHSTTRIRTDSLKADTANGSVVTKKKTTISDTSRATRTRADSSMSVSPLDSTRMGVPTSRPAKTPPRWDRSSQF